MGTKTKFPLRSLTVLLSMVTASFSSVAQVPGVIAPPVGNNSATTALPTMGASTGEADNQGKTWLIKPRLMLMETITDHVNVGVATNINQSDEITTIAPGIRIQGESERIKAYFDYALNGHIYANNSDRNTTQNQLNTFGSIEVIDNWLYVDFNGRIGQQVISSFGAVSPAPGSINANSTSTSNFSLSPYVRGTLGSSITYLLRYNQTSTQSNNASIANIDVSQWVGQLKGGTAFKSLSWAIDANQQTVDYSSGRKTEATLFRGIGTYTIIPEFRVSLSAGQESNNYASPDQEKRTTHGYGFDWTPTERTKLSVFRERRFFGNADTYSITHRFARSSISYTDSRNVNVLPNQFTTASTIGSTYDLFYPLLSQLCTAELGQLSSQAQISQCVITSLAALNLPTNYQAISGFLSSRATITRAQQLGWTIQGARNTLSIIANRSENQSTLATTALNDDFKNYTLTSIQQRGISLNFTHRLSGDTNLGLTASRQRSEGTGSVTTINSSMTMYQANISTKLGPKTSGTISLRHVEFDSEINPYTENALVGTLAYIY